MSDHVALSLHRSEEAISCNFDDALVPLPAKVTINPISDYFESTGGLTAKIVSTKYADDSEVLGLLVLGVVSSAEFYFRSIFGELLELCPLCKRHTEAVNIPVGSFAYYESSGYSHAMSAFEHESLADSKKIIAEIKRFSGFNAADDGSVKRALDDFEKLCEIRHCFVHARGFAGLKAARALSDSKRTLQKVLMNQSSALDLIKLSHNAVRAVNRYLANAVVNRWIDRDVLAGEWLVDKPLFERYVHAFFVKSEDAYSSTPYRAYSTVRSAVVRRNQAIAARA